MPLTEREQSGVVWYTADLLNTPHGFSTRKGGISPAPWDSLNLRPGQGDGEAALRENYRRFFAALGLDETRAVLSQQTHTANVLHVTEAHAGMGLTRPRSYAGVDALITNTPNLPLVVFSADCGIILLHDPVRHAVGAVHAGWRGCAAGILEQTVRAMSETFGSQPADLTAATGPSIGSCCFETDSDVPAAMRAALGADAEPYLEVRGPKYHVDLAGLNRQWLLRAGLAPEHIDTCGLCTGCHPELFWSHRKLGDTRGAQVAVISLSENTP